VLYRYDRLQPFEDALPTLEALSGLPNIRTIIFSNGTHEMVTTALDNTQLPPSSREMFLVEAVKQYKPAPAVYHGLVEYVNSAQNVPRLVEGKDVWLVSGNPFDVTGARSAGLNAIWVNRQGKEWVDQITPPNKDFSPTKIVSKLSAIPGLVGASH